MKIISARDLAKIERAIPSSLDFQEMTKDYEARIATCENLLKIVDIIIKDLVEALATTRKKFLNAQALNYIYEKSEDFLETRKINYSIISANENNILKDLVVKYSNLAILNSVQGFTSLFSELLAVKISSTLRK